MEWPKQRLRWIPLFYLLLLTEQASGFSACQHPPQEIRISRGQKITVVYWVGQNALEDGGLKDEEPILQTTETQETPTTEATGDSTQNVTTESESNSTAPDTEFSTTSASVVSQSTSELSTEKEVNTTASLSNEEISTEFHLQVIGADQNDATSKPDLVKLPEAPLSSSTTLNANALPEDHTSTTEPDSSEFLISGRNNLTTEEEQSNLTISGLPDVTEAQSEASDMQSDATSVESQNDESETPTASSLQSIPEQDGGTEVEYWSTTEAPEEVEADTDGTLLEGKAATETLGSTTILTTDHSLLSTTQLPGDESEDLSGTSTDATTDIENSTVVIDEHQGPNSDNESGITDGNAILSENINTSSSPLGGRSQETATSDALPTTEENDGSDNATFDSITNETLSVDSSELDTVPNLEVRASLFASSTASQPGHLPENGTENNVDPTNTPTLSVLESISTTIKNLFSTSDPVTVPNSIQPNDEGLKQESDEITLGTSEEQPVVTESSTTSDVVFPNTTADPEILIIDPREPETEETNSTNEDTTKGLNQNSVTINTTDSELPRTEPADMVTDADLEATTGQTTPADQIITEEQVDNDAERVDEEDDSDAEGDGQPDVSAPAPIDPFEEMPGVLIPIGGQPTDENAEDFLPETDTLAEEGRRIGFPMDQFDPFASADTSGPILIPLSDDAILSENEGKPKDPFKSRDKLRPIFLPLPAEDIDRSPLAPPPIFLRFPNRGDNSFSSRHGFKVFDSPSVFVDDLQPEASSSSGPFYRNLYASDQVMMMPPESPVHYVSALRPPDGVLPIQSLRTSPSKRKRVLQSRNKRNVNDTNCEWIFKSDPGVPLLLTFKSFSTPETTDCEEHYISVERESNGFQSRWCGVSGERPGHASFARSEIRLHLFSKGDGSFPTGFSVEVQALDLKLLRKYAEVRRIIKNH